MHIKLVHKRVLYDCELCDYMAARKSDLDGHMKSVHEEAKYSCVIFMKESIKIVNFVTTMQFGK